MPRRKGRIFVVLVRLYIRIGRIRPFPVYRVFQPEGEHSIQPQSGHCLPAIYYRLLVMRRIAGDQFCKRYGSTYRVYRICEADHGALIGMVAVHVYTAQQADVGTLCSSTCYNCQQQ